MILALAIPTMSRVNERLMDTIWFALGGILVRDEDEPHARSLAALNCPAATARLKI
jgi:hypothetical protein